MKNNIPEASTRNMNKGFTSGLSATEENTRNLTLNDGFNICIQRNSEIAPDVFESPETWRLILRDDEEPQEILFSGRWWF